MRRMTIKELQANQKKLLSKKNRIDKSLSTNLVQRYVDPVVTPDHVPLNWRYDLNLTTNPYLLERLGVNATFNAGAIEHEGEIYVAVRVEGVDRKSIFALAKSKTGIDHFVFVGKPLVWDDIDAAETNVYDLRLVKHQDGWIYGIYCSEAKDPASPKGDTSMATAKAGILRTKDLITFERLPSLVTPSPQQRNVVLHPEFVNGRYLLYTRPQDGFIETGSGGGIAVGFLDDMTHAVIAEEKILDPKRYHTIYELKNGLGPSPIKTAKCWIHLAHGVRNTAAGLRYVLYLFATSLSDPTKIIAKPSGYFMAPQGAERVGDVSNVLFSNGWVRKQDGTILIYYASSDTRLHVAETTEAILLDYIFNHPVDPLRSLDCAKQRIALYEANEALLSKETL
ncbi:MAG: glycosidase [Bacillus subtilis]|nr:glycosidase [Bacillus subtilis]